MDQLIVTLEGKDHKIGYGEHTMCMIPVPHGTTREEGAKECKTCFPANEPEPVVEEVFSLSPDTPDPVPTDAPDSSEATPVEPEPAAEESVGRKKSPKHQFGKQAKTATKAK